MTSVILTTYQGAILGPIARILGYILEALYNGLAFFGIENVGLCIILFTFIVNGLMTPMQIKQQKFSRMSAKMNPELMAIQNKYKDKRDQDSIRKMQMEQQAVYTKYGVSPAAGCLPLLITFPIIFALYRVIYNIPAYVEPVKNLYEGIATAIQGTGGDYVNILASYVSGTDQAKEALANNEAHQTVNVMMSKWPEITEALAKAHSNSINYIIDILSQFKTATWDQLANDFPTVSNEIANTVENLKHVNYFLGMNIADNPSIRNVTIIIPIIAVITQIVNIRVSMAGSVQTNQDEDNPMASSMKTMNTVMPFVSGLMCLMFPIGIGLYWIAGNLFRIVQGICINTYMNHLDIDAVMEQNVEKTKKRYEKLGIDPNDMNTIAKKRTNSINVNETKKKRNISEIAKAGAKEQNGKKKANTNRNSANDKNKGNPHYKEGSIAAYANMLSRNSNSKEDK